MYWLSVLFVTVLAAPLGLTTSLSPRWDDMRSKHSWGSIPEKWECQGHPPVGTIIDLRIALKPHRESALIDALYEVSDPNHSKYVSIPLLLCVRLLAHACNNVALQIRCASVQGVSRRACRSSSRHTRTRRFLACTPRGAILGCLDHAWRGLVDNQKSATGPGKYPPWRIIPNLASYRDERECHSHRWLLLACRLARARADGRTDDILWIAAPLPATLEIGI
jgi:hypothetical protein